MYSGSGEGEQVVDARPGDIMKAKPKYFEPRPAGSVRLLSTYIFICADPLMLQGNVGQHPVIVLTSPDASGRVKIATMSHSHPNNPPTKPASMYGLPIDPVKGESTVNVGEPYQIHISFLRGNTPHTRMSPALFIQLKNEICE